MNDKKRKSRAGGHTSHQRRAVALNHMQRQLATLEPTAYKLTMLEAELSEAALMMPHIQEALLRAKADMSALATTADNARLSLHELNALLSQEGFLHEQTYNTFFKARLGSELLGLRSKYPFCDKDPRPHSSATDGGRTAGTRNSHRYCLALR